MSHVLTRWEDNKTVVDANGLNNIEKNISDLFKKSEKIDKKIDRVFKQGNKLVFVSGETKLFEVDLSSLITDGVPGEKGDKGDKGDKGESGITPDISIGGVTTTDEFSLAAVTRRGTNDNPIFDFVLPRGQKGETPSITIGEVISGEEASVTARKEGNIVILDFSLPIGLQGIQGIKGDTGPIGPKGDRGEQGPKGEAGTVPDNVATTDALEIVSTKVTELQKEQEKLFQSVSSGKNKLEAAITDKGGTVSKINEVATFEELNNGIKSIKSGDPDSVLVIRALNNKFDLNMPENISMAEAAKIVNGIILDSFKRTFRINSKADFSKFNMTTSVNLSKNDKLLRYNLSISSTLDLTGFIMEGTI